MNSTVKPAASAVHGALRRTWQLLATALSFAVFGLGGLFFACAIAPVLNLAYGPERRRRFAQGIVSGWFRLFIRMMRRFGLLRYEVEGLERLRQPGQVIVANHPTLIDVVFLVAFAPKTVCVVKSALWRNLFTRSAVRAAGYLHSDLAEELLDASAARLRAGYSVLVFPEGTRSVPGRSLRFQRGFANIALHAGAPVRPVEIRCAPPALNKRTPWYHMPPRRLQFRFRVHVRIPSGEFQKNDARALAARRLTRHVEARYARWLGNIHEPDFDNITAGVARE
jgi:1-acyl-sn-glycerol-3-phosphate acyltransferase